MPLRCMEYDFLDYQEQLNNLKETYKIKKETLRGPEKLCGIGLAVPQATRIAMALKARSIALPESIYTYEQLKAALLELKGVGTC